MGQYCAAMADLTGDSLAQAAGGDYEALRAYLRRRGVAAYEAKVAEIEAAEAGLAAKAGRFFVLAQTDNLWKEHLMAIKFLQQAVSLRGSAPRDPLTEYKLEGYQLFLEMCAQIRRNVIYNVYCFAPEKARVGADGRTGGEAAAAKAAERAERAEKAAAGSSSRKKKSAAA
jgi:preprotein translocase subunit SecA